MVVFVVVLVLVVASGGYAFCEFFFYEFDGRVDGYFGEVFQRFDTRFVLFLLLRRRLDFSFWR